MIIIIQSYCLAYCLVVVKVWSRIVWENINISLIRPVKTCPPFQMYNLGSLPLLPPTTSNYNFLHNSDLHHGPGQCGKSDHQTERSPSVRSLFSVHLFTREDHHLWTQAECQDPGPPWPQMVSSPSLHPHILYDQVSQSVNLSPLSSLTVRNIPVIWPPRYSSVFQSQ